MKVLAVLLAGLTAVTAQSIEIGAPAPGTQFTPGQSTVVMVETPDFLSSSVEVSVAIGIVFCPSGNCPSPSGTLGTLLFSGTYRPQRSESDPFLPPHENYTVTIPANLAQGPASIGVAHFALLADEVQPFLETKSVPVVIQ